MALFKKKLSVDERMFYESFPAFVPLDALCRGIKQAGNEAGLNLATSIEEVKAEGVNRQAVKVQGNVPNAGSVEMYIVQSNMGNTHFFAGYWEGLVTFKENFGLQMIQGDGFFADIVRGQLQKGKDVKFARAYDFLNIVNDTVIPRAIEIYAEEALAGGGGTGGGTSVGAGGTADGTGGGATGGAGGATGGTSGGTGGVKTGGTGGGTGGTGGVKTGGNSGVKTGGTAGGTGGVKTGGNGGVKTGGNGGVKTGGTGGGTGGVKTGAAGAGTKRPTTTPAKHDTVYNKLVALTREEAATGCVKMIPLSDGRTAKVTIPAGIKTDSHVDVPGEGRLDPNTGKRGILRLSFYIQ